MCQPSGSRMPVVGQDGPFEYVYMIDLNPLAVRHTHSRLRRLANSDSDSADLTATAIVENVGTALPGVIDPECSAIPYVVYRFKLPYVDCSTDSSAGGRTIRAVEMSLTGFTIKVSMFSRAAPTVCPPRLGIG